MYQDPFGLLGRTVPEGKHTPKYSQSRTAITAWVNKGDPGTEQIATNRHWAGVPYCDIPHFLNFRIFPALGLQSEPFFHPSLSHPGQQDRQQAENRNQDDTDIDHKNRLGKQQLNPQSPKGRGIKRE
jgi:hypothetical protein